MQLKIPILGVFSTFEAVLTHCAAYVPPECFRQSSCDDSDDLLRTEDLSVLMTTTTSYGLKLPKFHQMQEFDVYCLGVTIIQLINGRAPSHLNRKIDHDRKQYYTEELLELIESMVAESPSRRPKLGQLVLEVLKIRWHRELFNVDDRPGERVYKEVLCEMDIQKPTMQQAWDAFHDTMIKMSKTT